MGKEKTKTMTIPGRVLLTVSRLGEHAMMDTSTVSFKRGARQDDGRQVAAGHGG